MQLKKLRKSNSYQWVRHFSKTMHDLSPRFFSLALITVLVIEINATPITSIKNDLRIDCTPDWGNKNAKVTCEKRGCSWMPAYPVNTFYLAKNLLTWKGKVNATKEINVFFFAQVSLQSSNLYCLTNKWKKMLEVTAQNMRYMRSCILPLRTADFLSCHRR